MTDDEDIRDMLHAAWPQATGYEIEGDAHRGSYRRILAWANARRDAAVADRDAEIARLRRASGWMPIETAPKDGAAFLAYPFEYHSTYEGTAEAEVCIAFWCDELDGWRREGETSQYATIEPTHWQPLPEPPND